MAIGGVRLYPPRNWGGVTPVSPAPPLSVSRPMHLVAPSEHWGVGGDTDQNRARQSDGEATDTSCDAFAGNLGKQQG